MNKIKDFFNEKFGTVRTVEIDGTIYFVGLDIARALGYSNERKAINTQIGRASCRERVSSAV